MPQLVMHQMQGVRLSLSFLRIMPSSRIRHGDLAKLITFTKLRYFKASKLAAIPVAIPSLSAV